MEKKTKNIIAIAIIAVLIICLAFTIKERGRVNGDMNSFARPNINDMRKRDNRFNLPRETKDEENSTEENKDSSTKSDNDCHCNESIQPRMNGRYKAFYNDKFFDRVSVTEKDDSLGVCLIAIETFLLGGSVMFLILNNIENDKKKK